MSQSTAPAGLHDEFEGVKQRSLWLDALERLVRNRAAMLGLAITLLLLFTAAFGPYLAPYSYTRTDITNRSAGPTLAHPMGTDLIGRDLFTRIIHGARTAVLVAIIVTTISVVVGVALGAIAAFRGGWLDDVIMRLTDATMAFPELLLAAFVSAAIRRPVVLWITRLHDRTGWGILENTVIIDYLIVFGALAIIGWAGYARLIRGQILSLREQDFVRAEVALGLSDWIIIRKHLVPNALSPVVVALTLSIGSVILAESSLSFLGFGIQPPGASWGNMLTENLFRWRVHPHLVLMPGLTLAVAVFGFNYLGDGLNDALNPRQIRR